MCGLNHDNAGTVAVLVARGPFTGENRLPLHNVDQGEVDGIQESDRSLRLLRRKARRVMRTEFCRTDSIFRELAGPLRAKFPCNG